MRKMRAAVLGCAAMMLTLALPAVASAAISENFFSGGNASAGWTTLEPGPPGSTETQSIALSVNGDNGSDFDDFAGVAFDGLKGPAPANPPSFAFQSDESDAGSGGSPRLAMDFVGGGNITLRPLSWEAGTWVTVDGAGNNWDVQGGSCGFRFAVSYDDAVACFAGKDVKNVIIVSDSGWFHPGGYTHYIDDVSYGDTTLSHPTRCNEDLSGEQEDGPVSGTVRPLHEALGSRTGDQPGVTVKQVNCDVVVPAGL